MKIKFFDFFDFLYIIIGVPWLFMMIATSRGFTSIKLGLLVVLGIIVLFENIMRRVKINKKVLLFTFLFVSYYMLSLEYGIINGYKFILIEDYALLQYYFITPILVVLISLMFKRKEYRLHFVFNILKYITLIVVILNVDVVLAHLIGFVNFDFLNLIMIASDVTTNGLYLRVSNEANLMFLLPMYIILLFDSGESKKNKFIYFCIIGFGLIYALLSGRKMLEIVIAIAFFIVFIDKLKKANKETVRLVLSMLIVIPLAILAIQKISEMINIGNIFELAMETLKNGLSKGNDGVNIRVIDTKALFKLWLNSPIWGNGLNSHASVLANGVTLWSYEVVYFALLAQTGLIGITLFFYSIYYLLKQLFYRFKETGIGIYKSVIVAFLMFILCGASNPLVYFIWPWIICVSLSRKGSLTINERN